MDVFKYTKLVSETGKSGLIVLAICTLISIFFLYRLSNKTDGQSSQYTIFIVIGIVVFLLIASKEVIKRLNSKASWEIVIDDKTLQWSAPNLIDQSFTINLNQIKVMEKTFLQDQNDSNYRLLMQDGSEIALSKTSELNFDAFIQALKDRGVQYKEIENRAHP